MNEIPQSVAPGFFPNNPDGTGLVFFYQFDADGRRTHEPDQTRWIWRSYLATDIRARVTLDREPLLPAAVKGSLVAPGYACHIDLDDGWLHGDLPDLRHDYSMEAKGLGHFRFALNDTLLIDGRKQPLRSVDNVRRMVEGGTRPFRSPAELLEVLMGQSLDGLSADHLRISEELDAIEERIVRDAWHSERKALNDTRRRLVAIHRQMASVAGLFRHLEHAHQAELPEALADMAARTSNRATALHHDGEQLQARARLLQDELMAKLSEQSNQLLYFLSMLTAVLLPMTIISGLFGMNVGGIPLSENPTGFWTISIFATAVAVAVLYILRRIGGRSGM